MEKGKQKSRPGLKTRLPVGNDSVFLAVKLSVFQTTA
jgi:hypothetical protein